MATFVFTDIFAEIREIAVVTSFGALFQSLVASFTHAFNARLLQPSSVSFPIVQDLVTAVDSVATFLV